MKQVDGASADPTFEPESVLSKALGLDAHPELRHTIDAVIRVGAEAAGVSPELVNAHTDVEAALAALKLVGITVGPGSIKALVQTLVNHIPDINASKKAALVNFLDALIDAAFPKPDQVNV